MTRRLIAVFVCWCLIVSVPAHANARDCKKWQFSIRTLLIAITAVAAAAGYGKYKYDKIIYERARNSDKATEMLIRTWSLGIELDRHNSEDNARRILFWARDNQKSAEAFREAILYEARINKALTERAKRNGVPIDDAKSFAKFLAADSPNGIVDPSKMPFEDKQKLDRTLTSYLEIFENSQFKEASVDDIAKLFFNRKEIEPLVEDYLKEPFRRDVEDFGPQSEIALWRKLKARFTEDQALQLLEKIFSKEAATPEEIAKHKEALKEGYRLGERSAGGWYVPSRLHPNIDHFYPRGLPRQLGHFYNEKMKASPETWQSKSHSEVLDAFIEDHFQRMNQPKPSP